MAKTITKDKTSTNKESKRLDFIHIKGAKSNNLKDIELILPKNKLIVVTGLSGSGKSSLIMDTLYAEGQRRYVESLSSYARQFMNRMKKPEVDFIKGLCPAIAIEQRTSSSNARSTVGSLTEIYDFLRLLFARIGKTISPISGDIVKKHTTSNVVDYILSLDEGTKIMLFAPVNQKYKDRTLNQELNLLMQKGYSRIKYDNELSYIEDFIQENKKILNKKIHELKVDNIYLLIDRFAVNQEEENRKRMADSIQLAFQESEGECQVSQVDGDEISFNNRFELDGLTFIEPSQQLFNFNNPFGACPRCEGYGRVLGIDPNKVIPDKSKSIYDGAVACWKGEKSGIWLNRFIDSAHRFNFPVHKSYHELSNKEQDIIWNGNSFVRGINDFFSELEEKTYKIQNRILLARYRGKTNCPDCNGMRLRKEAFYVKISGKHIGELTLMPLDRLQELFLNLDLNEYDQQIAKRILLELNNRLKVMNDVGLNYLNLDRLSSTLSGGETQRIHLTRTLGSNLTNSLYILDEPSVGLHPKDTEKLVAVLKKLRDLQNTVVVVEHEEEVIKNADYIVDIGPAAGIFGGEVVYNGSYEEFMKGGFESLTYDYMSGVKEIPVPKLRRKISSKITLTGAKQHNLKNITADFPLQSLTLVTGVSGSGKTTLVKHILYPALKAHFGEPTSLSPGAFGALNGDLSMITQVELISQNPIGKSSRSNPVTYVKAYDSIRKLFANQQLSKIRGYKPKHFSFNVDGGRCDLCKGEGEITVEMQFLADVKLTCEDCRGRRFKTEVLEIMHNEKNIFDILDLSIEEALDFFADKKDIISKIQPLYDVGLGYVKLGQSSSTLSGGEAQRIKLASYLGKERPSERILFIFDEPSTGLHFHDINKLMSALNALVEKGHTVIVVEHNLELIKSADWIIDLGPVGGEKGGELVYQGVPEGLVNIDNSYTGHFLKGKL